MPAATPQPTPLPRRRRIDSERNQKTVLDAAAEVFVEAGVDAPVRQIAMRAGVGVGTVYRHFPTRADLIVAVYRHQLDACAAAGPDLLRSVESPYAALTRWIDIFVDFLVTKHGLAASFQADPRFGPLHASFLERLVPVCAELLAAAERDGEVDTDVDAYQLMRGIGNLCIAAGEDERYDARRLVALLVAGLRPSTR